MGGGQSKRAGETPFRPPLAGCQDKPALRNTDRASETFLDEIFYGEMRGRLRFFVVQQALDVFREDVGFDVDGVVDGHAAHVGVRVGEGDDGDVGDTVVPAGYGEADAVERDGGFFCDVAAEVLRDADGEPPIFAFGDEAGDAAYAVH